jgi:hypothetical protein
MEARALVASGCRHRGPARRPVDRGRPRNPLLDRRQHQCHSAGPLPLGEFSPRILSKFHARIDGDSRILRTSVWDCSIVTAGDLV